MVAPNDNPRIPEMPIFRQFIRITTTVGIILSVLMISVSVVLSFVFDHNGLWIQLVSIGIAGVVFANAIPAWQLMWSSKIVGKASFLMVLISGLALTGLGSAAAVWAIHLSLGTGDWEYPGILRGMLLSWQGIASVVFLFPWKVLKPGT